MNTNQALFELDQNLYLPTFKRYPLALDRGEGALVWDVEGNQYLDTLAGIAVNSLGHCHPDIVKAIRIQSEKLIHISNFYLSRPQVELSEKLINLSKLQRVFFTNSGAESVEGAFKIARKYAHSQGRGGKILSFKGSFHGRTLATIAAGKPQMQRGFEPIPQGFEQIPFNDLKEVEAAIAKSQQEIAAIIIEPVQGEGGVNPADREFMVALREICSRENIVLIFDEIQTGIGRTGKMFAAEHFGVVPDIMTLAKALGSGFPIGAILFNEQVSTAVEPGDHGTTFGGNPLGCAVALATLEIIQRDNLLSQAETNGKWLRDNLSKLNKDSIREIRGMGLMIGIEFNFNTKPLVLKMMKQGVLANSTADNVLRLVPPLIISRSQLQQLLDVIQLTLKEELQ